MIRFVVHIRSQKYIFPVMQICFGLIFTFFSQEVVYLSVWESSALFTEENKGIKCQTGSGYSFYSSLLPNNCCCNRLQFGNGSLEKGLAAFTAT